MPKMNIEEVIVDPKLQEQEKFNKMVQAEPLVAGYDPVIAKVMIAVFTVAMILITIAVI
jgi:hypothetical protein